MSLADTFCCLLRDDYNAFIITVGIYTSAIYCIPNGRYKVFDSHGKDLLGMAHPLGTCTLIEIDSLNNLVQYFCAFFAETINTTYELKGVSVCEMQIDGLNSTAGSREITYSDSVNMEVNLCSCKECCAISFYAICFSTLLSSVYWNCDTVESIIENGKLFYQKYYFGKHPFISDLPNNLDIDTAHVDIVHGAKFQGILSVNSPTSKEDLKDFILNDTEKNTGFLLWISSYCISCIFQFRVKQGLCYNVLVYEISKQANAVDIFLNVNSLLDMFCDLVISKFNCCEKNFEILFLSCSCELSNKERKQIVRKHKSSVKKKVTCPAKKR